MDMLWNTLGRPDWERLADRAGAGLQQRWDYGAAVEAMGGSIIRVTLRCEGRTRGLAQVIRRGPFGLITRGPLWLGARQPDAFTALRRCLRAHGIRLLAVTPPEAGPGPGPPVISPATLALLPMAVPDRARLAGKWRSRLAAAERAGLTLRLAPADTDRVAWLLETDRAQQKRRGYRALPARFTQAWIAGGAHTLLALAAADGAPVAAMLFLRHGTTATYHIGWTGREGRARNAHNLLLWRAAERLAAEAVHTLDLGLLDTVNTPGLARFKLGTGAMAHRLGATRLSL